jgi:hypothetical protein
VNRKQFGIRFVCALAVLFATCAAAQAQREPVGGPFDGLFRGSPREQPQRLDLSGSAFEAWDDNVLAQGPNGTANGGFGGAPQSIKPGYANGFTGSLNYGFHRKGTRSELSIGGNGSFQEFASSAGTKMDFESYALAASLRTNITNKMSISFTGGSTYAPYYQYAPFLSGTTTPESPVGADYGFAVNSEWVRTTTGAVSVEDRFTKKSSVSGTVSWNEQVLTSGSDLTIETETASMRFTHSLTRKLSFYVGYGLSQARYTQSSAGSEPFRYGNMDIGIGYGDGLTFTFARHYTLNLSVGASIAKNGDPASVVKTGRDTALVVNGSATLSRTLGRTWAASIGYVRGTSYVVGFTEPFNTDTANAGIGGPIVSRLYFSLGGGASRGQMVFSQDGTLVTYTGSARLTYGIFTNVGLYAQASYYKYSVPNTILEAFQFTPQLERRSISAGVTTWLPLIKPPRVRRVPNDQQAGDQ